MRYRMLSPTGDYLFGNGQANFFINSPEAVAQVVETSLRLFYGEWYLDTTAGMPWLQEVFGYNTQAETDAALISYILGLQGIQDLTNWSSTFNPETRAYSSVTALLYTIYGPTPLEIFNLGGTP